MTPYYQDDLVTIYHADCREVDLGSLGADVIVTDPPYGISYAPAGGGRGYGSSRGRPIPKTWADKGVQVRGDDQPFDPAFLLALAKPTVLFGANHYGSRLPDASRWLVWDKRDGAPSNDFADCEMAWSNLSGPARLFHHRWLGLVRR